MQSVIGHTCTCASFCTMSAARSPVFSHLSASLLGLGTIRAFSVQEKFAHEFDDHQDLHTEAWFLFIASSRWLAVRLDWLCASFVSAVAFCSVLAADSKLLPSFNNYYLNPVGDGGNIHP